MIGGICVHISYELAQYLQQLHSYVSKQNQKIKKLELMVEKLENTVNDIKQKPNTNIERIEYKFDQLKIETLEGTLNIGLNPSDTGSIDDFSVSNDKMQVPPFNQFNQGIVDEVRGELIVYLEDECIDVLNKLEVNHGFKLDDSYRNFVIDDIYKQLDSRIEFYLNQQMQNPTFARSDNKTIKRTVVTNLKKDIENAIDAFISNLPDNMKGGD